MPGVVVRFELPYVWVSTETANRKSATASKIAAFADLPVGWSYGRGRPPSASVRFTAQELLRQATRLGLYKTDAFPGESGEIALTIYAGLDYLEFIVEPNLSITYMRETDDVEIAAAENLSSAEAIKRLEEFAAERWNSLGWSPSSISIEQSDGSTVWHLGIPQTAPASQSSPLSVSSASPPLYVGISDTSIPKYHVAPRSSGGLQQRSSRPVAV